MAPAHIANAAAQALSRAFALTGTVKQVSWAESIREDRADELSRRPAEMKLFGEPVMVYLFEQQTASWWIETCQWDITTLLQTVAMEKRFFDENVIAWKPLQGSHNAKVWAETIRFVLTTKMVRAYVDMAAELKKQTADEDVLRVAGNLMRRSMQFVIGMSNSSTWIDMREKSADKLLNEHFLAVTRQQSDLREAAELLRMRGTTK